MPESHIIGQRPLLFMDIKLALCHKVPVQVI